MSTTAIKEAFPDLGSNAEYEAMGCPSPKTNFDAFCAWHEGYRAGIAKGAEMRRRIGEQVSKARKQ